MSNTFDGVLREFPYIGVDCFNTAASVFLLTHCHADHLTGITNKSFSGLVYCSENTKKLLSLDRRFAGSLNLIMALPYNERTRIETPHDVPGSLFVTLIEAYHCLGACMFLVEEDASLSASERSSDSFFKADQVSRAVLCTGDLRAEQWWREGLHMSPALFPYMSGDKPLDCIYFDSTFAYRGEPYIEIPPNSRGIQAAASMLREYPKNDPEIDFEFTDTTLGFEQAWAFILHFFGGCLSISNGDLRRKLLLVAANDPVNGNILSWAMNKKTSGEHSPIFHGGTPTKSGLVKVRIKQCINFNIKDYAGVCCPISLDSVPPTTEMQLICSTQMGNEVYEVLDRRWIRPRGQNRLLPLEVKLLFSRHSSFSETRAFLSMFRPKEVFPCSYSREAWLNGFSMARVFGDICSETDFNFDKMMTSLHGVPPTKTIDQAVMTINRWSIDECNIEQKFIEDLLQEKEDTKLTDNKARDRPALLDLRKVARAPFLASERKNTDFDFLARRGKDFKLQKIAEGRRNDRFERFIREQQMLYYRKHNLQQSREDHLSFKRRGLLMPYAKESSGHETDSCASSFDLLESAKRSASDSSSTRGKSLVRESQQGLFWKVHKVFKTVPSFSNSSFVQSSFSSFEENRYPVKPRVKSTCSTLFASESRVDVERIHEFTLKLAKNPRSWQELRLSCVP